MEKYYAVLTTMTATSMNASVAGECRTLIHGKDNKLLLHEGDKSGWANCNYLAPYWVREYAYKRPCDARRNWSYNHPENSKWWTSDVSIVTLWVRKDNTVAILR